MRLFLNTESVFVSDGNQERSGEICRVSVSLQEGINRFLVICECTEAGFGCRLANAMPQWEPCNFLMPFASRDGAAGFAFTEPLTVLPCDMAAL